MYSVSPSSAASSRMHPSDARGVDSVALIARARANVAVATVGTVVVVGPVGRIARVALGTAGREIHLAVAAPRLRVM